MRSCQLAAELDPQFTSAGYCYPNHRHVAAGSIAMLNARPRMSEILRILPGSSLVAAPTDRDLATPEMPAGLEELFGGGGYTAKQRTALLQMAWDHVSSALDGRESASNCTPMVACSLGAAACGAISTATMSWRMQYWISSTR